jgi:oligopeptide/dipeptide ABC transporter ATP-binding protein
MSASQEPLIRVEGLRKLFPVGGGLFRRARSFIHAVDGLDFAIYPGETLGLAGESGCGKTTTGMLLVKLLAPTGGRILLRQDGSDIDVAHLRSRAEMRAFRRRVQMIFQDPYESTNPRLTLYDTIAEPLAIQGIGSTSERRNRAAEMLELVGLTPAAAFMSRYPHELSGGQRQRVAIARALVMEPAFVAADEPTSMLDVSIRIDIMRLMLALGQRLGVSYLYVTHDLAVARYMCGRIAVMYLGKIVEMGDTEEVLQQPQHPYTRALLAAVPSPDPRLERPAPEIKGSIPRPIDPPPRCRFFDRCTYAQKICEDSDHPPIEEKSPGHYAACYVV